MAALKLHIVQRIHYKPKLKGQRLTSKNFILDCVHKMTESAQTEGENDSTADE
jgi:hypothetical protein